MDLDQNWQLADPRDQEIEELIAAGLPSPLMPSPFMVAFDEEPKELTGENPVVKQEIKEEIKEEPIDHHDESQLYQGKIILVDKSFQQMCSYLGPFSRG